MSPVDPGDAHPPEAPDDRFAAAFDAARLGDLSGLLAWLDDHRGDSRSDVLRDAATSLVAMLSPSAARPPALEAASTFAVSPPTAPFVASMLARWALAGLVSLDARLIEDARSLAKGLETSVELAAHPASAAHHRPLVRAVFAVESIAAFAAGRLEDAIEHARDLAAHAMRERDGGGVVHGGSLRALAELALAADRDVEGAATRPPCIPSIESDAPCPPGGPPTIETARTRARHAARMGRTEGFLEEEYFANLVLARARRRSGAPHLALRILEQLEGVLPSSFAGTFTWERTLAGAADPSRVAPSAATEPAELLTAALTALAGGDVPTYEGNRDAVLTRLAGFAPFRDEAAQLFGWLDPAAHGSPNMFRAAPPPSLAGVGDLVSTVRPRDELSFVLVAPGLERPRRVLTLGLPLARARFAGLVEIAEGSDERRPLAFLAEIALAGDRGVELEDVFERIYGFPFASAKHDDVVRKLTHRARSLLGSEPHGVPGAGRRVAELERRDRSFVLVTSYSLAIPDPRHLRPLEGRALALLARAPAPLAARELASRLRVPLRTLQLCLSRLQDEGACHLARDGRSVGYVVEDSVFREPSLTRLAARTRHRSR